ncbi:hypothetical protein [Paenarthrobacter ilicis]|uniref:Uncharacterized protein n=1 Tax=Paenarthrobacter ilicis TaxID=43665 RepID=A0ABX0TI58_9MICC|nr:hypothetical protein [Paenarthrobacter ilicis]MBM7792272.1 hypothetical protein [Paenarthrobacter ilicis]NIJ00616.1 hypothetical protein [Paenarthrobacter ilicis]
MRIDSGDLWALLHQLDDPAHVEMPQGFDWEAARRQFDGLVFRLNAAFGSACGADRSVQDATYHAQVIVPAAATATGRNLVVRVSNFGGLAVLTLENPGAYDQEEFDALVHESDIARISKSLDAENYILIPEEPLWRPYDGCVPARVFLPSEPSWWLRYFDYL